jgi:acetolactate synthase-1/2/3 large subunit
MDADGMNGAQSLVDSLLASGIDTCFGNPGTSEMHLVAALAERPEMRCILGLFEGVVTGAADGFARMADRPAMTLLHCGPGLANGVANLHNARRANTTMVNCVGDLASYYRPLGSPLASDIEAIAGSVSHWVYTAQDATLLGADAARAVMEARSAPGRIATLIIPSDTSWGDGGIPREAEAPTTPERVTDAALNTAIAILRSGQPVGLIIGGAALRQDGLRAIASITAATGAVALAPQTIARMERGVGLAAIDRIPVPAAAARVKLSGFSHLILIGTALPVGFFAYRDLPHQIVAEGTTVHPLCGPDQDVLHALQALADLLGGRLTPAFASREGIVPAMGAVTPEALARSARALLPEHAIVVDESIVVGRALFPETIDAVRHDWLQTTGGAIGDGMPLALGAAVACPDRRVVNFQADGSAMYTVQALWTQARERLDVTTVILANRSYAVLHQELSRAGVAPSRGTRALLDLDDPTIDWVAIAKGMGVEAAVADSMERFNELFERANRGSGPFLIELQC